MKNRGLFIAAFAAFTIYINASVSFVGNNCDPDIVAYMQEALTKKLASISPRYNIEFSFVQEGDKVIVNYSDDKNGINGKEQTADIWSDVDKMINNLANGVKEQIERDQTQRQQKAQESVTPVQKPASKTQQTTRQTPQHTAEEMQFLKYAPSKVTPTKPVEQIQQSEKNTIEEKHAITEQPIETQPVSVTLTNNIKEQSEILIGHGDQGSNSWILSKRNIRFFSQPSNNFKQAGKVVVSIEVDAAGNVVSAMVADGTTVTDLTTIRIALKAAKETKFSTSSDEIQIGTITYIFKYK